MRQLLTALRITSHKGPQEKCVILKKIIHALGAYLLQDSRTPVPLLWNSNLGETHKETIIQLPSLMQFSTVT